MFSSQRKVKERLLGATLVSAKLRNLATTQRPSYSVGSRVGSGKKLRKPWNTILYQGQYEPGSTMKAFALLAGRLIAESSSYNEVYQAVSKITICDWGCQYGA